MSTPGVYTGTELADALRDYGDLPVAVCVVDDADQEGPRATAVRLELSVDANGARVLVVTGYLDQPEDRPDRG